MKEKLVTDLAAEIFADHRISTEFRETLYDVGSEIESTGIDAVQEVAADIDVDGIRRTLADEYGVDVSAGLGSLKLADDVRKHIDVDAVVNLPDVYAPIDGVLDFLGDLAYGAIETALRRAYDIGRADGVDRVADQIDAEIYAVNCAKHVAADSPSENARVAGHLEALQGLKSKL